MQAANFRLSAADYNSSELIILLRPFEQRRMSAIRKLIKFLVPKEPRDTF